MGSHDRELLTAIIAAVASLVVAIVSVLATARTNRRVASLTEELEEQKLRLASELAEHRAVCEPLLFEAAELAERARSRILSIARTCRQGDLRPDGSGWLAGPGYYFRSTVCFLLAPMTSFKILQRRLTVIDLSLEPRLRDAGRRRLPVPELRRVSGRAGRQPLRDHPGDAGPHRALRRVPPQEQPALWRVLVTQVLLYDAFLHAYRSVQDNDRPLAPLVTMPSDEDIALLDWRGASDQAGDAVVREPVMVAHGYLQNRVAG